MASSLDQPPVCEVCDEEKKVAAYRCLDCKQNICTYCCKIHHRIAATSSHSVADVQQTDPIRQQHRPKCRSHDEVMQLYCTTCDKLICQKCTETAHCHPKHEFIDCTKASASFKQSLSKFFTPLEKTVQDLSLSLATASKIKVKLDFTVERTIGDVKSKANEVKKELSANESHIIDKIREIQTDRSIKLDEHKQVVTTILQKIQHSLQSAKDASCTLTDAAFLNLYPSISKELETLTSQDLPQIDTKLSCMRFDSGQSNINLGQLELKGRWKLTLTFGEHGSGPREFSSVRSVSSVPDKILLADYNNKRVVVCNIEGYQISSIPMQSYPRDLQAFNDRVVVVDSTSLVKVFNNDSTQAFDFPTVPSSETDGTAVDLWSMTVKKDGTLVIGDTTRSVLTEHNPVDGTLLRTIPVRLEPQYIALLGDDRFLVSSWREDVDVVDSNGATLITIKPKVGGYGVSHCTGVCSDESGIYIGMDNSQENGHVHHYDHDGKFLECIAHGLLRPQGIALIADGEHLAVSDWFSVKMYHIM